LAKVLLFLIAIIAVITVPIIVFSNFSALTESFGEYTVLEGVLQKKTLDKLEKVKIQQNFKIRFWLYDVVTPIIKGVPRGPVPPAPHTRNVALRC